MALDASQLQEVYALTTQHINDSVPDLFTRANYLYKQMLARKNYVAGGRLIQLPVFGVDEVKSMGFISGTSSDNLNLNLNQTLSYGELNWKFWNAALTFDLKELTITEDSPHAIKSFVATKTAGMKNSMVRALSEAMHGNATTDTNKFNGFGDIFATSGTAYAGINNTDIANWFWYAPSTIAAANYTNLSPVFDELTTRVTQTGSSSTLDGTAASYKPDLILSDRIQYNAFKVAEQLKLRFTPSDLMKSGFTSIKVDGIDWVMDTFSASSRIYVLTSDSFEMFYKYGFGKKSPLDDGLLRIPQQPVKTGVEFLAGNMGCTNRRVNAMVVVS
jgi:hypothetical protein